MNDAHVNAACLDFLVQELVPTAVRVSSRLLETFGCDYKRDYYFLRFLSFSLFLSFLIIFGFIVVCLF
jgi:hypothetical protein